MRIWFALAVFMTILAGCQFGSAEFHVVSGDLSFSPAGTVYAWIEPADGRDTLNILATWVTFDPQRDLTEIEPKKLAQIQKEFLARDRVHLRFAKKEDLVANKSFQSGKSFIANLHFEYEKEESDGLGVAVARQRTTDFTVDEIHMEDQSGKLKGRIGVWLSPAADDQKDAKVGQLFGLIEAPIVPTDIAVKNMRLLMGAT